MPYKIGYKSDRIEQDELVVNISEKCNCFCLNCPNDTNFRLKKINVHEVINFIDKNLSQYTDRVTFIGGEPTIIKSLFKFIKKIRTINKNAVIQINSNGRMFCYDSYVKKFLDLNDDRIEFHIALYASNPKLHDKLTRVSSSFEQTVKGIHNLLKNNFRVYLRNVVHKLNYKGLEEYGRFIINEFDRHANKFKKLTIIGADLIGDAHNNRKLLAIQHKLIAPYIEKFVDKVNVLGYEVEVHLIPNGVFSKKYQKYVKKSGCVDGAFTDNYGCGSCIYQDECPRLLKSYVEIFGNKDHEPVIKDKENLLVQEDKISGLADNNNLIKEIKKSNLSINEIIGLSLGLKEAAIIDYVPKEHNNRVANFLKNHKILYKPQKRGGSTKLILSKDTNILDDALMLSIDERKPNNYESIKEFGRLLGYPLCCVNEFVSLLRKKYLPYTERQSAFDRLKKPIPFLLNSLTGRYNLINHIPCSSNCQQSLKIAQKILDAIKKYDEALYQEYITVLKSPVVSWNENQSVTLIGKKTGNLIEYKGASIRHIPEEDKEKCQYDKDVLSLFRKGDKIIIEKNSLDLYKNKILMESFTYSEYGKPAVITFN